MTLVSIVTPTLDQARYLPEAIESVRAQTYSSIEHIVVDGGSTDGTLDLLDGLDGIRWISEADRGQSHALNKGFALATGDVLGWLNADDSYEPDAVAQGVEALRSTGAALVYADVTRVNDDGRDPRRIRSRPAFDLWTELNLGGGIYSPAVFFTREALDSVGPIDETLHLTMDYDLWLRIGKRFPVRHVDAVWAVQRVHPGAKSVSRRDDFWPERLRVSRRHGGRRISPLLISRHIRGRYPQLVATRLAAAAYRFAGKAPQ